MLQLPNKYKMYRLQSSSLALALLCACCALAKEMTEIEVLSSKPTHCTYERAYDMYGAHCAGLRLTSIPPLRGSLEILDFSDNKLRELLADTFSSYTSVKFLYLSDNQIYFIDETALTYLTSLETLDLSKNVITELPISIFQLPSLRKLYLNGNPLIHMSSTDFHNRPIKAPLELLDLSDCKITELPNWGILPQLKIYNISHNPLISLEANHFAMMCNLAKVDITHSINKIKLCNLKPTITWFQEKHIYFTLDDYSRLNSKDFENCPAPMSAPLNSTYQDCKTEYLQVQNVRTSRRKWLTITGGLLGFLVGFILLLYVMHRRNVEQTKNAFPKNKATPMKDGDKQATAVLLDNV